MISDIKTYMHYFKLIMLSCVVILISGFTDFTEKVPAPKDVPKRSENVDAGIVIPSFDCTPYEIIKNSYDPLAAFMYDPEEGIFVTLSTPLDFKAHKLTFYHKKFGFVTKNAYRVSVAFLEKTKDQKMSKFSFCPFEMSSPVSGSEVKAIAESWTKFFDSLGWIREQDNSGGKPFGTLPENGNWPYMMWLTDGFRLSVNISLNDNPDFTKQEPKYYILIVFSNYRMIKELLNK